MRVISAQELEGAMDYRVLVERLRQSFRTGVNTPIRQAYSVPTFGRNAATLLTMPAWQVGRYMGVKIVSVFPDNADKGLPSVQGAYLLMDARTGAPRALIDGPGLTTRRTAAASALAASYLARADASRMLMVGTGAMAPRLILAHAAMRPIKEVQIWGRTPEKARRLAKSLTRRGFRVTATEDLEAATRQAHIISCATLSHEPLIEGTWLAPGTHLDLVGGFTPQMREADDEAVRRARIFVDTREGALAEAGDIIQPLDNGIIGDEDIAGDLFDLARGSRAGRRFYDQITLFKSVGTALEDLAAAQLAFEVT